MAGQKSGKKAPRKADEAQVAAPQPRRLLALVLENGKSPVREWLRKMRDKDARAKIERALSKLRRGLGDQKGLQGVAELKVDTGPGYRVYYAYLDDRTVVVLIYGGEKDTQQQDIKDARQLWEDFNKFGRPEAALREWEAARAAAAPGE